MTPQIQPMTAIAYEPWLSLWADYLGTQFTSMEADVHPGTFARLNDPQSSLQGLVAIKDKPVGFAHFYFHASTYSLAPACTLDDLYVAPECRGQGVARQLIEAVAARAREAGAYVLHWKTRDSNLSAISLYDKIGSRSGFLSYRLDL
jgi:ribosomal protein S18 acetylase RimI-like enzyme